MGIPNWIPFFCVVAALLYAEFCTADNGLQISPIQG